MTGLSAFLDQRFDLNHYLTHFPDVEASPNTAREHWLRYGSHQGVTLSPKFVTMAGQVAIDDLGEEGLQFTSQGRTLSFHPRRNIKQMPLWAIVALYCERGDIGANAEGDFAYHLLDENLPERRIPLRNLIVTRTVGGIPGHNRLVKWRGEAYRVVPVKKLDAFAKAVIDPEEYCRFRPDVASSGMTPVRHWVDWGIDEGVRPAPGYIVEAATEASYRRADLELVAGQRRYVARATLGAAASWQQIVEQAVTEPALLGPGLLTLPNLDVTVANDLSRRTGMSLEGYSVARRQAGRNLIVMPRLSIGGAEHYAITILESLRDLQQDSPTIVVTDQDYDSMSEWLRSDPHPALSDASIISWRDACGGNSSADAFARYVLQVAPKRLIVCNSVLGLDVLATWGASLRYTTELYCCFFNMGLEGLGAPLPALYARRILRHAAALVDNKPVQQSLLRLYGAIPGAEVHYVPPRIDAELSHFRQRLDERFSVQSGRDGHEWLWLSRISQLKGIDILTSLARLRPAERFHVYGPLEDVSLLDNQPPNVIYHGVIDSIDSLPFAEMDGFLFTSRTEGMPRVALEMAASALPLILSDVGGLRATFDDSAATFVNLATKSVEDATIELDHALDELCALTAVERLARVKRAFGLVKRHHRPSVQMKYLGRALKLHCRP